MTYIYTCEIIITIKIVNISITLKSLLVPFCNPSLPTPSHSYPRQPLIFLKLQISLHFLEFYINETIYDSFFLIFFCLFVYFQQNYFEISLCCCVFQSSFLFYCWVAFYYMGMPYTMIGLFLIWGYYKYNHY